MLAVGLVCVELACWVLIWSVQVGQVLSWWALYQMSGWWLMPEGQAHSGSICFSEEIASNSLVGCVVLNRSFQLCKELGSLLQVWCGIRYSYLLGQLSMPVVCIHILLKRCLLWWPKQTEGAIELALIQRQMVLIDVILYPWLYINVRLSCPGTGHTAVGTTLMLRCLLHSF